MEFANDTCGEGLSTTDSNRSRLALRYQADVVFESDVKFLELSRLPTRDTP